jgi:hypothetical protein
MKYNKLGRKTCSGPLHNFLASQFPGYGMGQDGNGTRWDCLVEQTDNGGLSLLFCLRDVGRFGGNVWSFLCCGRNQHAP